MNEQSSDRFADVLRLTTALADRVLDAQIMKRPVAEEQVRALASAARLLRENDVDWPPLLTQVLHELAQHTGEKTDAPGHAPEGEASPKIASFRRFLGALRGTKPEP